MGDEVLKQLKVGDKVEYKHVGNEYRGTVCKSTPGVMSVPYVYIKTQWNSEQPLGSATITYSEYFKVNGRSVK